MTTRINNLY